MSEEEEQNRFSLRKLSIGLASVLVGVSIFGTSQTVKADTVADQNTSAVTSNAQSSDTQENKNAVKSSFSNDNQTNNAKSNLIQTQVEGKNEQKQVQTENVQQDSVSKTQEATDSNDLQQKDAEKGIVRTSSLQKTDNQSNDHTEDNSQTQPQNSKKLAKKVLATNLIETTSSPTTNGGFDEATWGKLDVTKWQGSVQDGVYELTGYTGDLSHIIVPNEADFEQAGKSTNGLQVGITCDTVKSLLSNLSNQTQTIAFSKTNNQKVKAVGTDWSNAFNSSNSSHSTLSKFDGSSLDVSNVTNMSEMFWYTSISDLTSLANWDTSKVTDMSNMFANNSIGDLRPLANWDTSNVTDMYDMFGGNSISDLKPLANWDTSKVTNMSAMFGQNSISDLTPLANWKTSKVTNMSFMFGENLDLSDLSPIANWNISSVDIYSSLFLYDTKLNLTNINNTPLMQGFLKTPNALQNTAFVTNNADLVKAITDKDLPTLTNTAKRTITFNIPNATPKTIVQTINYKAIAPVQIYFDPDSPQIAQTYPVKESDWQLDTSKQNDAIVVNGQIRFASVKIPHVNGYKAYIVQNKSNPALFTVSFIAVPTENKPSTPVEATPSKPSAPTDNSSNSAWTDLKHKVVDALNQSDSGWTMPENNSTYTVEVPDDAIIDLSDLVIAEPVHAQTRAQIRVNKRFKLSKKHVAKHLKHRKKAVRTFKKYRL